MQNGAEYETRQEQSYDPDAAVPPRSEWYTEGQVYYASAADAAFWRKAEAEKAAREAERRAQYEARQRSAAQAAAVPAGVDGKRLAAAATLACRPVGPSRYLVWGGRDSHWVDLLADGAAPRCDCGDHAWRGGHCKHILCALAAEGDAELRAALAALTPATRRAA